MAEISRRVRIAAWIVGGLLAIVVLLVALLHTPPVRRYALKQAVAILGEQGIRFDASNLSYNLLELKATLNRVEVRSPQQPDLPPILLADRAEVDLSLRKLIQGDYDIEDATVRNPRLHVVITEDGRDNIPRPPAKEKKSETKSDYLIDQLSIEGGSLRYEDRKQKIDAQIPLERLTVDGNPVTGNHDVQLTARTGGSVAYQGRTMPLTAIRANVLLEDNAADLKKVELGVGSSTVSLSGRVDDFKEPKLDIKADSRLALASLVEFAGIKQTVAGDLNLSVAAQGPLASLKATARAQGRDLTVDKFGQLDVQTEAAYDAQRSRVLVQSLNVVSPSGTVRGNADLALNAQAGQSTANIAATAIDLFRISSTLDLPVKVASRADAKVAARWPELQFDKIAGDATVSLNATRRTPARDVVPVSGSLNAKTQGNRIVLGIPGIRTLDAQATGQIVLVNQQTVDGNVRIASTDLEKTIAQAEAFLGRKPGTLVGTRISGPATINADLGGSLKSPTVLASIDAPKLTVGTIEGIEIAGKADYNQNRLLLSEARLAWQGQQVIASGTVGLGRRRDLDLVARSEQINVQTLLAGLGRQDVPVQGIAEFDAKITGTAANPAADVRVNGTGIRAYNENFGDLRADAQLRGDVLTISDLRLEKPQEGGNGSLTAAGNVNIETKTFAVDAKTENFRLTTMTLPDGTPIRGGVDLNAQSRGTTTNPAAGLQLALTDLRVGPQAYGDVKVNAQLAEKVATVDATAPAFNLTANAKIGTDTPYPATFQIDTTKLDLAALPIQIDAPVKGVVSARLTGTAPLANAAEQAQVRAEVSQLDLEYNGQPIRTEGPLLATYADQRLTIENATVVARESRINVKGTLPLEPKSGGGSIALSAQLDLPTLMTYLPAQPDMKAQGTATIDGTITGSLQRIDPNITVQLNNGLFMVPGSATPVSGATLRAQVSGGVLRLETASANIGPAAVSASGTVPFGLLPANLPVELPRAHGPAQFTAELQQLDLTSLPGVPSKVSGIVSARLEASAPRADLAAVTGSLTLPELWLGFGSYIVEQQQPSVIRIENGTARVDQFALTGPSTKIQVAGTAGLTGTRPLDLRVDGNLDASLLSAFSDTVQAQGATELRVALSGTATDPKAQGYVQLADAQFSLREPRVGLEDLNVRLDLAGTRADITRLSGLLNGGDLSGGGTIEYAKGRLVNTNVNVKASGTYLDFPEGLKTISNIDLRMRNVGEEIEIGGQVDVEEGGFTDDLDFDRGILAAVNTNNGIDLTQERNPLVEAIRFNLGIRTTNPLVIDNNLAEAEITADLRLLGNPYQPGMSGQLTIDEGGLLRFQEREYTVERAVITFTNERKIEPGLDILATTTAAGYDIRMQISGEPGDTETVLTSDPPLSEPDILAVLLTGKPLDEIRGQEFEVARNQVLSYLTGRVGSQLGRGIASATGLSTVRIEPNLIAAETNPGARLTVGQDITRNLELIYSMDLVNSSDQIYVAEYDISRRFTTRGVRQSDGSLRMDFRHDVRFGGVPEPRRGTQRRDRRIGNVTILGNNYFAQEKLADKLDVETGDRYDFFKLRKRVDKINEMLVKANLLESTARLRRTEKDGVLDLTLTVKPGPTVDFVFEGISVPNGVQKDVRQIWSDGVFDRQRAEEAVEAIRTWLVKEKHLQSQIEYAVNSPSPERKRVTFDIRPGPQFNDVKLVFEGAKGLEADTLAQAIDKQELEEEVYIAPDRVTELLTRFYQEQGYLDAVVNAPRYELNADSRTGQVVFPVNEGPLFRVGNVTFEGNTVYNNTELATEVPLPKGEGYRPVLRQNALDRIREMYWRKGYNDVDTEYVMSRSKQTETVDLTFRIAENRQSIVRDITIEGNTNTSRSLIATQVELKPGEILDLKKLGESRRNLYNTGAFSSVEIAREEIPTPAGEQSRARTTDGNPERPMRLAVRVREVQPFQLRYGGFFDTERGPGVILDFSTHNKLGSARVIGLRARYDKQLQEGRVYFSQPSLLRFPVKTIASPFILREKNPATETADPFNVDRIGFDLQQEAILGDNYILNYGYRLERNKTYDPTDPLFFVTRRIGGLTSSLSRDSRDEILDATRGSFISHAVQFAPTYLGSDIGFVKYFGQYFKYIPLQKERVEMFTNEILRPRLVYAGAVRIGLSKGFSGVEVPLSERFLAGGANTVRGFEQNALGPVDFDRTPLGGEAMIVINNEIRMPLFSIFDGVGFLDIGNVYPTIGDLSLGNLRKAGGVGLRIRTPWFLLRADYGVKLDRRPDEPLGRFFFSIGQAF